MTVCLEQLEMWHTVRSYLQHKQLLAFGSKCLSTRIPGTTLFWFGNANDRSPGLVDALAVLDVTSVRYIHALVYLSRLDVSAISSGSGSWGQRLLITAGTLPIIFDDQARHLGSLLEYKTEEAINQEALRSGTNVVATATDLMVFGMTGKRLIKNAELLEVCAAEHLLAETAGKPTRPLPWLTRYLATRCLRADEKRAAKRSALGLLPWPFAYS